MTSCLPTETLKGLQRVMGQVGQLACPPLLWKAHARRNVPIDEGQLLAGFQVTAWLWPFIVIVFLFFFGFLCFSFSNTLFNEGKRLFCEEDKALRSRGRRLCRGPAEVDPSAPWASELQGPERFMGRFPSLGQSSPCGRPW